MQTFAFNDYVLTIFWGNHFLESHAQVAFSLRAAGQLSSVNFTPVSGKITRIFILINNLQPVAKILWQLYQV